MCDERLNECQVTLRGRHLGRWNEEPNESFFCEVPKAPDVWEEDALWLDCRRDWAWKNEGREECGVSVARDWETGKCWRTREGDGPMMSFVWTRDGVCLRRRFWGNRQLRERKGEEICCCESDQEVSRTFCTICCNWFWVILGFVAWILDRDLT